MELYARQGDLVFNKLPDNFEMGELVAASDLVLAGSTSSRHVVRGPSLTREDGTDRLVKVVTATQVSHDDRHLPTELIPGNYRASKLRERHGDGDRQVED